MSLSHHGESQPSWHTGAHDEARPVAACFRYELLLCMSLRHSSPRPCRYCYAVVAVVGETAFTRSELKTETPGRPGLVPIAGLSAVTVLVR